MKPQAALWTKVPLVLISMGSVFIFHNCKFIGVTYYSERFLITLSKMTYPALAHHLRTKILRMKIENPPWSLPLLSPLCLFLAGDFLARAPPIAVSGVVTTSDDLRMRSSSEALVSSVLKPHPMSNAVAWRLRGLTT